MAKLPAFLRLPVSEDKELMARQKKLYPAVLVEQTSAMLLGLVNVAITGTISRAALAGVGQVNAINNVIVYFFSNFAIGGNVMVAQNVGAGNKEGVKKSASQSLVLGTFISLIVTFLVYVFREQILLGLYRKVEADVMTSSLQYFAISCLATPMWFIYYQCVGAFRSSGDTRTPMKISVTMNAINIVLGAVFVLVLKMGPAGSGLSTLCAVTVAACMGLYKIFHPESVVCIRDGFGLKLEKDIISKVVSVGVPAAIENVMFNGGKVIVQVFMSGMGTIVLSGYQVFNSVIGITQLPLMAYSVLVVTLVGQAAGSGSRARTKATGEFLLKTCKKFANILIPVRLLVCYPVALFFSRDPDVLRCALTMYVLETAFMPFWASSFMLPSCFRATRDVRFTLIIGTISMWSIRVFGSWVLGVKMGMQGNGIVLAMCLDWILRGIFFENRLKTEKWLTKMKFKDEPAGTAVAPV